MCDTGLAFNQIEIAEWPAGPGRSGQSVWFHVSHDYQSSSLSRMQGQVGLYSLLSMVHKHLLYVLQRPSSTLHPVLSCLLSHISIFDHGLLVFVLFDILII